MEKTGTHGFFYKALCGFLLGLSIIAPGISGSIIAVMMGIYDRLIAIAANPFKNIKRNVLYLIPMCIGAVISAVLFVLLFKYLFDNYPTPTSFLFIALVFGMFPPLYKKTKLDRFKTRYGVAFALAIVLSLALSLMNQLFDSGTLLNQLLHRTVADSAMGTSNLSYLCLSGLIAGMASVVPGMSVSVVLMLFGVYTSLMAAASSLEIWVLLPFAVSFLLGMVLFSKVVKFVFKRYNTLGFYAVFGFMLGSIFGILPALPTSGGEWLLSVGMLCVGGFFSVLLAHAGKKLRAE
jgi:putative membrane protein